jgi:hypothetical protein
MSKPNPKPEKQTPEVAPQKPGNGENNGHQDPFAGIQMLEGTGPLAGLSVALTMLTPEISDAFPEETPFQRKFSKRTGMKYSRLETEGKWINEYPAPFLLDKDGNILDGGHRKFAVRHSRVAIPIILVKGVSHKAVHAIDRPRPRSLAANLAWDGKNAPGQLAQMLRFYRSYDLSGTFTDFAYDVQDWYETLDEQGSAIEEVAKEWTIQPNVPKVPAGLFGTIEYLIKTLAGEEQHDFLIDCARGEALTEGDPAFAWREWVTTLPPKRTAQITAKIGYTLVYCWDKFRRNQQVTKVRVQSNCPDIAPLEP